MNKDIRTYNNALIGANKEICELLSNILEKNLPNAENKIWYGFPVWFIDGNPVVGYTVLKSSVRLMFWSGQTFDEAELKPEGKYKAAQILYTTASQIDPIKLADWLKKAQSIQWDYKNIVKNKGVLKRLK